MHMDEYSNTTNIQKETKNSSDRKEKNEDRKKYVMQKAKEKETDRGKKMRDRKI